MENMILTCSEGGTYVPHPEGIHPAVCVDAMDLGLVETEYQGQRRLVNKVRLVFESEQKTEDGRHCTVSRNFTASLHSKAKLAEFLGKWRGRPVLPGESIELARLIGAGCTLVVSHQSRNGGRTFASIDAVSKPTRKVTPSGQYDPAAARRRYADRRARQAGGPGTGHAQPMPTPPAPAAPRPADALPPARASQRVASGAAAQGGPAGAAGPDPEVGF